MQQRDVTIEIDSMDKVGGFVGYLIVNGVNMSIELVKQGLSKVHYSGEQGKYANQLLKAQTDAQQAKLNIWKDWEPPKEVEEVVPAGPVEVKFYSFEIRFKTKSGGGHSSRKVGKQKLTLL